MSFLYAATELGSDLQGLGFLGHQGPDAARLDALQRALCFELPRSARWLARAAAERGLSRAEVGGWILAGEILAPPGGLASLIRPKERFGPDGLPSARFGGLLRLGQAQNQELWGADMHRKAAPVYLLDPSPEGMRGGWRRRFDRLDDFVFYGVKATLCQRDRITVEEFLELARERGVRPEELIPDALEEERQVIHRLNLRRPKKVAPIANRFLWLDILVVEAYLQGATPGDIARIWVDFHKLHRLSEETDRFTDPSVVCFWMFKHALFGDDAAYKRVKARGGKHPLVAMADVEARTWGDKRKAPFDRKAIVKAIEMRASMRGA